MQYRIKAENVRYMNTTFNGVKCPAVYTLNAEQYLGNGKSYAEFIRENPLHNICNEGDVIVEYVGTVKRKPKIEKRVKPFEAGKEYEFSNGSRRVYMGTIGDRAIWINYLTSAYMTKTDGTALDHSGCSAIPETEEVEVGYELVVEK